jgi:hypothetical protein
MAESEEAVRAYLQLCSPTPPLALPEDPIARLLYRAAAEREFVRHAQGWARHHGIGWEAFAAEGVPREVLDRAGLRPSSQAPTSGVADAAIQQLIPRRQPFTVDGLVARTGASRKQVLAVITRGTEAGEIEEVAVSVVEGKGRPSKLFRRVS